jgi:hypothetical protein
MVTHEKTRVFWGVKSGDYVQKGIVFSFCPFCGEKIINEQIIGE